ncbi:hypothetical protein B0O80DRAFT_442754 [Mortierella sp. GBAus27b]|nr:hypothetical protein B0O80DRAFT_442754 [Mortierella sp. GBAus27b]
MKGFIILASAALAFANAMAYESYSIIDNQGIKQGTCDVPINELLRVGLVGFYCDLDLRQCLYVGNDYSRACNVLKGIVQCDNLVCEAYSHRRIGRTSFHRNRKIISQC